MDDVLPTRPAGFWIRAVAFAIDAVVCMVVQMSFVALGRLMMGRGGGDGNPAAPAAFFFTVIFAAAYWTTLHMVAGQTLGKSIVGVRVVGTDGALLTFGPAFLRYLASGLSLSLFGFGYLMAGLRRDKRALHDLIAGSRVERPIPPRPLVRRVVRPGPVAPTEPPATPIEPLPPVAAPSPGVGSAVTAVTPPVRSFEPPPTP
jgi:uncharacterized RDD family membrane protein YckC